MGWVGRAWNPATVSVLAGLFGSRVGACASTVRAWIAQRHHERKDLMARAIAHREQLYSDFISEGARAMVKPTAIGIAFFASRVAINGMLDDQQAPFGFKHSGVGREFGRDGIKGVLSSQG